MISIIIPTYNKDTRLKVMLQYLSQIKLHEEVEIVIVNDGSTDNTKKVIENYIDNLPIKHFKKIKVFNVKNKGRSSARNIGISASENDLILFLDDDIIVHPDLIINHVKLKNNDVKLVLRGKIYDLPYLKFFADPITGRLYESNDTAKLLSQKKIPVNKEFDLLNQDYLKQNIRVSKFEKDIKAIYDKTSIHDSHVRWFGSCGANLFVSKQLIYEIGNFDENFGTYWGCEDLELGYRLYKYGNANFIFNKESIVYHMTHYRNNYKNHHQVNMSYFIKKHNDKRLITLEKYFNGDCDINKWITKGIE